MSHAENEPPLEEHPITMDNPTPAYARFPPDPTYGAENHWERAVRAQAATPALQVLPSCVRCTASIPEGASFIEHEQATYCMRCAPEDPEVWRLGELRVSEPIPL